MAHSGFTTIIDHNGIGQGVKIVDNEVYTVTELITVDGEELSVQHPLPTDGDSVYAKDVDMDLSDLGDFSGSILDLYDDLHTTITDVTATNPKELLIHFKRTVVNNAIGLGTVEGDFSNVEIQVGNSGGVFTTVIDESAIDTKYTTRTFRLESTIGFNIVKFLFHTADPVTLSNSVVLKSRSVVARVHGPNGLEYAQDSLTGDRIVIDHAHAEIHEGLNFTRWVHETSVTSLIIAFKVADQSKHTHLTFNWKTEESSVISFYRGATWTPETGVDIIPINSSEESTNTSILQGDASGAFLSNAVVQDPTGLDVGSAVILYQEPVWGTNQAPASPSLSGRAEHILKPGETYAFQIVCVSGGAWMLIDWYEHTPLS